VDHQVSGVFPERRENPDRLVSLENQDYVDPQDQLERLVK